PQSGDDFQSCAVAMCRSAKRGGEQGRGAVRRKVARPRADYRYCSELREGLEIRSLERCSAAIEALTSIQSWNGPMADPSVSCPDCGLAVTFKRTKTGTRLDYSTDEWTRLCKNLHRGSPFLCMANGYPGNESGGTPSVPSRKRGR